MLTSLLPVAEIAAFCVMPLSAIKLSVASAVLLSNVNALAMVMLPAPEPDVPVLVVVIVTLVPTSMADLFVLTLSILVAPEVIGV